MQQSLISVGTVFPDECFSSMRKKKKGSTDCIIFDRMGIANKLLAPSPVPDLLSM